MVLNEEQKRPLSLLKQLIFLVKQRIRDKNEMHTPLSGLIGLLLEHILISLGFLVISPNYCAQLNLITKDHTNEIRWAHLCVDSAEFI